MSKLSGEGKEGREEKAIMPQGAWRERGDSNSIYRDGLKKWSPGWENQIEAEVVSRNKIHQTGEPHFSPPLSGLRDYNVCSRCLIVSLLFGWVFIYFDGVGEL